MQFCALGRTGLHVSTIGVGTWGMGGSSWMGSDDRESLATLRRAVDCECTFFDTALEYGAGHSEELVGKIFHERRGVTPSGRPLVIASKVPPKNEEWPARPDVSWQNVFPAEHVVACTEATLRNLGCDTIDLQQFHVWNDHWLDEGNGWLEGVEQLKRQGKIRWFGISCNDHDPASALQVVASGLVDTIQVIYNIFDQTPGDALLPAAQRHGVGVIVRVPLDEGGLTGNITVETTFPAGDFRNAYFGGGRRGELIARVEQLKKALEPAGARTLADLALRFALSHPAVSVVIPGMRRSAHVEENVAVSDAGPLPETIRAELRRYRWNRNWY